MSKKTNRTVIFTGNNGFPFGSAVVQRQLQLANALVVDNFDVVVLNNRGHHSKHLATRENIKVHGFYNKIEYIYCSLLPYKPTNFLSRNIFKLIGIINQFFIIIYYRLFKNATIIFSNTIYLKNLKYHYYLTRLLKMQFIYDYVEIIGSVGNRDKNSLSEVKNSFDFDFYKYTDKVIVISDFLEDHLTKIAPNMEQTKIPPIIDFTYFDKFTSKPEKSPFLLFCGSAAYIDVIKFIVTVFINSKAIENEHKLKLVVNGSDEEKKELKEYLIENNCTESVEVLSQLTYEYLVSQYKSAKALLIPVGNNLQDQARFPFKICEYTASERPIITSKSGAIKEFFIDGKNAFVAKADDEESFTDKINQVIKQPDFADEVGQNGYNLGKNVFNYKSYTKKLATLINK